MRHRVDTRRAVKAGLIAGAVFLVLEMLLVGIAQGTPWGPPRMIGAILLGPEVLPPPAGFALGVVAVALLVHGVLSALYGIGIGAVVARMSVSSAVLAGAGLGLLLYLVNFYVFTAIFPWFANARTLITVIAHLVFGMSAAYAYKALVPSTLGYRRAHHGV